MGAWRYIFVIMGLALLIVTCVQQYKRGNKSNLVLRLFASAIAAITLTCIVLNITYTGSATDESSAIILTEGFNKDSVNLFKAAHPTIPEYSYDEYIASGTGKYLNLHLFGNGLSADGLQQLQNTPVVFHHQPLEMGIIAANWQQTLHTGEQLRIQGNFNNTSNTPVKLQLNGLDTLLDSATIQPGLRPFQLAATPKQAGKAVYNITALANDKIIEEEFVPVEVRPADSIKVLILAASPDFENRFLKNWLAENNCAVVARSTTSKDKFDRSFLNTVSSNIDHLTAQNLSTFDILISDATEYAALSRGEQNAVQSTVEAGMGLLIKTDTTLPSSIYASLFPVFSVQPKSQPSTIIKLTGGKILHGIAADQSLFIHPQPGTQSLATDSATQVLVNSAVYGIGKVAVTTLNNTYSWMLTGNKQSYAAYWGTILSKVARNKSNNINISFSPALPVANQPLHITFSANANPYPVINGSPVYLAQKAFLPFEWDGTYWPTRAGWQTIKLQSDSTNFYTYTNSDWKQVTAVANIAATDKYVTQQTIDEGNKTTTHQKVPAPKIYFVIVFLVCCILLWAERNLISAT